MDGVISYEDAVGLPAPTPSPALESYAPGERPMVIHGGSQKAAPSNVISYEDAVQSTPNPNGVLSNAPDDGWLSGAAKGLGTAAVKAVGNAAGFVGGLGNFADYLVARGESKVTGQPVDSILADMQKQRATQTDLPAWSDPRNVLPAPQDVTAPILKQTGEYVPTSEPGRMAQAGAEAALSSIGPGVGSRVGSLGDVGMAALKMATANMAAGAVGQGVTDVTGDPLLGLAAGVGGAAATGAAGQVAGKVLGPAVAGIPGVEKVPVVGPAVQRARENAAAAQVLGAASDPNAAKASLSAFDPSAAEIPGTMPTMAAVTNDPGLLQAEMTARTQDNIPFNARDARQNSARLAHLGNVQPNGDVMRPGQMIRQRLDALDAAAQEAETRLNAAHHDAVIRRTMASQAYADGRHDALAGRAEARTQATDAAIDAAAAAQQTEHERLVQSFEAELSRLEKAAIDAAAPLGPRVPGEQIGATLRGAIEDARAEVKKARSTLYKAVDKDGTLALVATPVRDAADRVVKGLDPYATPMNAEEQRIFQKARSLPDVMSFKSLTAMDQDVTQALAAERRAVGESPTWARLSQLKSAIHGAIDNAVENQAEHQDRLVSEGLMQPEDTIAANIQRQVSAYYSAKDAVAASGVGFAEGAGGRSFGITGASGTARATGRGFPDAASAENVPREALSPNFTPEAGERLGAAKAAHADYAQTYKQGPVGEALKTNGFAGQYRTPDGALPAKAFVSGDKGYQTVQAFLKAAQNAPEAVEAIKQAALNQIRDKLLPLGTVSPTALARWRSDYHSALRAIDAVSPGFSDSYSSAAKATQALTDAGVEFKQATSVAQKEAARQAIIDKTAMRSATGEANAADRAQVKALLDERRSDDAAQAELSRDEATAGIAKARDLARSARNTPAGQFAGKGDRIATTEVENAVGDILKTGKNGAARMSGLVASVSSDPAALEGLRKAGVDWMSRTFSNASEAGNSGEKQLSGAKLIKFVAENRDALKELYTPEQLSMFGAIARSIETDNKWITMTAAKNGPGTAKDLAPAIQKAVDDGKQHISLIGAATAGFVAGGPKGAAGGGAAYLLNTLRSAGIRKAEDLYREVLLDPQLAKLMISKMPEAADSQRLHQVSRIVRRGAIMGPMLTGQKQ